MKELPYCLTGRQSSAYKLLTSPDDCSVLYGGAKGGGKSFFLCLWVDISVDWLIKFWGLKSSAMPLPIGFLGRKEGGDFKHTTLETFKRIIPADHYRLREAEQEIIFWETAKVWYGGLDDQERIRKFNSPGFASHPINQAKETERTDIDVLQATSRLTVNGKNPPYKHFYTANPADCWLKEDFIDNPLANYHYIPALPRDNPHLPDTYEGTLKNAFRYNPALLAAYLYGDWSALQAENALLSSKMLSDLRGVNHYPKETKRIVGDAPRLGGDECVIYLIENRIIKDELILHIRDTMKIAGEMGVMATKYKSPNYGVDVIGIGQGIYDRLRELKPGDKVVGINSAGEASSPESYYNLRAEMAWYLVMLVQDQLLPHPEDEELRRQLINYRFKGVNSNGRIQLEPKEKTKQRIGRSPDRGDAFIMGIFALNQTEPIKGKDMWRENS